METVYSQLQHSNNALDFWSPTRAAVQDGIGGSKEEHFETYTLYKTALVAGYDTFVVHKTNASVGEALNWVAIGE